MAYPTFASSFPTSLESEATQFNGATLVDFSWIVDLTVPYLESVLVALAALLVGWLASRLNRWVGLELDRDHANALHAALARGVRHAISVVRQETKSHAKIDIESKLIAETAVYLKELMPGALRHFRLTDTALDRLIRAHLGPDVLHWVETQRRPNSNGAPELTR